MSYVVTFLAGLALGLAVGIPTGVLGGRNNPEAGTWLSWLWCKVRRKRATLP